MCAGPAAGGHGDSRGPLFQFDTTFMLGQWKQTQMLRNPFKVKAVSEAKWTFDL